jgi:hypothetical protein
MNRCPRFQTAHLDSLARRAILQLARDDRTAQCLGEILMWHRVQSRLSTGVLQPANVVASHVPCAIFISCKLQSGCLCAAQSHHSGVRFLRRLLGIRQQSKKGPSCGESWSSMGPPCSDLAVKAMIVLPFGKAALTQWLGVLRQNFAASAHDGSHTVNIDAQIRCQTCMLMHFWHTHVGEGPTLQHAHSSNRV